MNSTFKLYRALADCYKGTNKSANDLVMEAKENHPKHWTVVERKLKLEAFNPRRMVTRDGKQVMEEYKDYGNYDDTIVAKLMLIFESYIRSAIRNEYSSFEPEDIIFQAELSLRYAIELYQPIVMSKKTKIDKNGNVITYDLKSTVKFEEFWRRIFQSKVEGMYQDSNRECRKILYETSSLEAYQEDNQQEIADPNPAYSFLQTDYSYLDDLMNKYLDKHDLMSYLIVKNHCKLLYNKGRDLLFLDDATPPPEGYKEKSPSRSLICKQFKDQVRKSYDRKVTNLKDKYHNDPQLMKLHKQEFADARHRLMDLISGKYIDRLFNKSMDTLKQDLKHSLRSRKDSDDLLV